MRKIFLIMGIVFSLLFTGCGGSEIKELKSMIKLEDTFSEVNVEHYSGGGKESNSLTEEECKELSNWIATTSLEEVTFSEENQPSNLNGTSCYSFTSDSFSGFELYDMGDDSYFVRIENAWYKVVD